MQMYDFVQTFARVNLLDVLILSKINHRFCSHSQALSIMSLMLRLACQPKR